MDDSGSIVFVNQRATEVFGYAEDEMLGNPVEMLVPTNMRNLHASHRNEYHDEPHSRPLVSGLSLKAQHKDGRACWRVGVLLDSLEEHLFRNHPLEYACGQSRLGCLG